MAAHADDLRFFYAETLGDSVQVTTPSPIDGTVELPEPLSPGRYAIRILAYDGADVWMRQGPHGTVLANAATPSMQLVGHTDLGFLQIPVLVVMVRDENDNGFSFYGDGGGAVVQVTKISRDKR